MAGITSEEGDASESFSGIGMPKNESLFKCATSKSRFSSSTSLEMTRLELSVFVLSLLGEGASCHSFGECETVEQGSRVLLTSVIAQ
ncbi:hypothetical protein Tco_0340139 [Tanacetum coccineum]